MGARVQFLMHSHHDVLFEPTTNPAERYEYIIKEKRKEELALRLALFALVPDEALERYVLPGKSAEWDKARGELANAVLDKAYAECVDWEGLHRELCWSWCPGEKIFSKGYSTEALVP